MTLLRVMCGLAVVAALLCAGPGTGSAQTLPSPGGPHVIVYELTENLKAFRNHGDVVENWPRRLATAALGGLAVVRSPLCPTTHAEGGFCNVNIFGGDNISNRTLEGSLHGDFAVTKQGDNPFDGPEKVVLWGTFNGDVDFSPIVDGVPLPQGIGLVRGAMAIAGGGRVPFNGVFRLPLPCPFPAGPISYLATDEDGRPVAPGCDPVKPTETLFGRPMVRLDVWFEE